MRQEGWRQAALRYLGLLQYPDDRSNSQDARDEVGYKLSVLAELLYNSTDEQSHQVAYRIASVMDAELNCVPDALRTAVDKKGSPVAVPDLPSCLAVVSSAGKSKGGFLHMNALAARGLIGLLMILAVVNPFLPWPNGFHYSWLYIPIALGMGLFALG